jgi:hypothetical protein
MAPPILPWNDIEVSPGLHPPGAMHRRGKSAPFWSCRPKSDITSTGGRSLATQRIVHRYTDSPLCTALVTVDSSLPHLLACRI